MSHVNAGRLSLAVAVLLLGLSTKTAAEPTLIVQTTDGPLQGAMQDGMAAFKGIPFAAPPVGALRWRPPQPLTPWSEVRDATKFGTMCAQPTMPSGRAKGCEDCLTINAWLPTSSAARSRACPWRRRHIHLRTGLQARGGVRARHLGRASHPERTGASRP